MGVTTLALRTVLPKFTAEPAMKPLPVMPSVNAASPTLARDGERDAVENFSMASERLLDVALSGVATVMAAVPTAAIREDGIGAVNLLALTKVVGRAAPFH